MEKKFNGIDLILWKFASALLITIFSCVTFDRGGNIVIDGIVEFPDSFFYLLFAALHSYFVMNKEKSFGHDFLNFIANLMMYSAFYKLVLIPACGFGFIEWSVLSVLFITEFASSSATHCDYTKSSDSLRLLSLGVTLGVIKFLVRYALPLNLFDSLSENPTAMNLIFVFTCIVLFFAFARLVQIVRISLVGSSTKLPEKKAPANSNTALKIVSGAGKAISTVFSSAALPVIVVGIVCIASASVITSWIFIAKVRADIISLVSPILRFALKTDSSAYLDTELNSYGQMAAYVLFIIIQAGQMFYRKNETSPSSEIVPVS